MAHDIHQCILICNHKKKKISDHYSQYIKVIRSCY